jgi:hypothetical protein
MSQIRPAWQNHSPPSDGAFGWTVLLDASWAIWAIPTCLLAVKIFGLMKNRKSESSEKQKE